MINAISVFMVSSICYQQFRVINEVFVTFKLSHTSKFILRLKTSRPFTHTFCNGSFRAIHSLIQTYVFRRESTFLLSLTTICVALCMYNIDALTIDALEFIEYEAQFNFKEPFESNDKEILDMVTLVEEINEG